jgi:hypothetical protein
MKKNKTKEDDEKKKNHFEIKNLKKKKIKTEEEIKQK